MGKQRMRWVWLCMVGAVAFCLVAACGGESAQEEQEEETTATVVLSPTSGAQPKNMQVSATFSEAVDAPADWTDLFSLKLMEAGAPIGENLCTSVTVDPNDALTIICAHDDLSYGASYQVAVSGEGAAADVSAAATPGSATATFDVGAQMTRISKTTVASDVGGTVIFSLTFDAALPEEIDPVMTAGALTPVTCIEGADRTQFTCEITGVGGCKSFMEYASTLSVPEMMDDVSFIFNASDEEFDWSNSLLGSMIADSSNDACWGSEGLGIDPQEDYLEDYSVNATGSEGMLLFDYDSPVMTHVIDGDYYVGLYRELRSDLKQEKIAIISKTESPVTLSGNTGEWSGISGTFLNFDGEHYLTAVFHGLLPTDAGYLVDNDSFSNAKTFEYLLIDSNEGHINLWEPDTAWLTDFDDTLFTCVLRDGVKVSYYVSADGQAFTRLSDGNTVNAGYMGLEKADLIDEPILADTDLDYYTILSMNQAGALNDPVDIENDYAPMVDYVRVRTTELDGDGAAICAEMAMFE